MTLPKIFNYRIFACQKSLLECIPCVQSIHCLRCSTSQLVKTQVKQIPNRKLLKIAIIGRPNAGKSTLINSFLRLNVCGVSSKTHTTKTHFKAAFTQGDTQLIFMDTPGLVTRKEFLRFGLTEDYVNWKTYVLKEADIIGIVHELSEPRDIIKFHLKLVQDIQEFPKEKPLLLVLNKMDLVLDKERLEAAMKEVMSPQNLGNSLGAGQPPKIWQRFSKVFFTAAARDVGVKELLDYLLDQAKPGCWVLEPDQVHNKPLNLLVVDLLRARIMDILPNEVPYECKFEVEYLEENDLGEIICVSLITCKCVRHKHLLVTNRKSSLRNISKMLESDLYNILKKVFKIRIVVTVAKMRSRAKSERHATNHQYRREKI